MALAYTAPTWTDGSGEGISANNLQAISNCIEGLVQGSDKAVHNVQINGSVITLTYADGTVETFTAVDIKGISSVEKTSTVGLVDTYTITYSDGTTSTFTVKNGQDGAIQYTAGANINISDENEISAIVPDVSEKADITAIAPNEPNATASRAYAIGEHFYKNGKFCTAKTAIASGATFTLNTNYVEGTVADFLLSYSEQEQFTGEYWLDGKPIYKKTFVYPSGVLIPPNTWTDVNTSISYIKKIVRAEAVNINTDQAMNFISAKIDTGTGNLSVLSTRTVDVTLGALTVFYMKS